MSFYSKRRKPVKQHVGVTSHVQQHMKEQCDINQIMAKYEKGQVIQHVNRYQGAYGDFTMAPDYHEALNRLRSAEEMFGTLPARLREKFANDPGNFLDFVNNPENEDEMRKMGLLPKEKRAKVETPVEPQKEAVETKQSPKEGSPKADQV